MSDLNKEGTRKIIEAILDQRRLSVILPGEKKQKQIVKVEKIMKEGEDKEAVLVDQA